MVAETAGTQLGETPGALLLFPEGTRFSEPKRTATDSPYQYLLKPRIGGYETIQRAMPDDALVWDVAIRYAPGDDDCWRCMSGAVSEIHVKLTETTIASMNDPVEWLAEAWSEKDAWLAAS